MERGFINSHLLIDAPIYRPILNWKVTLAANGDGDIWLVGGYRCTDKTLL